MRIKKYSILFALLSGVLFSCSDDFLDRKPPVNITPPTFWEKDTSAVLAVNAIYNTLSTWDHISFASLGVTSIYSDDADKGSIPGDGVPLPEFDNLTVLPSNIHVASWWSNNFQGINKANQVLEHVGKMDMEDDDLKARLLGEAHFLRAYFFFNLVRAFGDLPKVDHLLSPEEFNMARSPKSEIYNDIIIPDLKDAIKMLPKKSEYPSRELGRATSGAAQGLLAKVYLFVQDFPNALAVAKQLIATQEYDLYPNYAEIFRDFGENCSESLFEVQCSNTYNGNDGYTVTQLPRDAGPGRGWGWGFNIPSQSLVDAYESGDPRKEATIISRGQTLYDGETVGVQAANPYYNYKAYQPYMDNEWNGSKNIRILRYADVLLVAAEAANETNATEEAQDFLNAVRKRARNGNTMVLPDVELTDKVALRHAIWHERRIEMAMERNRVFDLMRMDDVEPGYAAKAYKKAGKSNWNDYKKLLPLPARQIELSKGALKQNPGY